MSRPAWSSGNIQALTIEEIFARAPKHKTQEHQLSVSDGEEFQWL
jgi:hypothetical protein